MLACGCAGGVWLETGAGRAGEIGLDIEGEFPDKLTARIFAPPEIMVIERLEIADVLLITPKRYGDARGWFSETYREDRLAEMGFGGRFVQDNHSLSGPAGTLRGLHFQRPPHSQDKLVRVVRGAVLDVAVDIRNGSPTWGKCVAEELSAENGKHLLVPKGFLHGFVTLEPDTEVVYKVSDYYAPECDAGVLWNDPALDIDWGEVANPLLSEKDQCLPLLAELPVDLFPYGVY